MDRKLSPPPVRDTRKPRLKAPPGACDTHFHIFGPQARFPFNPNRPLDVEDSTFDDLMKLHDTLGVSRGVIVQSLMQGHCYEYMLNALCREPARFRGIAMPAPDITDGELEILDKAGVVGARFAYRWAPELDTALIARVHELGWHPQYWFRGEDGKPHLKGRRRATGEMSPGQGVHGSTLDDWVRQYHQGVFFTGISLCRAQTIFITFAVFKFKYVLGFKLFAKLQRPDAGPLTDIEEQHRDQIQS